MPKSKAVIKDEEDRSGSDAASDGPSTTSKKRQLDEVCQFQLFQPCFLTPSQSDEHLTKKAKIETGQVAPGSVCSIQRSLCISHMVYRPEKARIVKPKL